MCTILLLLALKKIEFFNRQTCSNFLTCLLLWIRLYFNTCINSSTQFCTIPFYFVSKFPLHTISPFFVSIYSYDKISLSAVCFINNFFIRLYFWWLNCQSFSSICKCVSNSYAVLKNGHCALSMSFIGREFCAMIRNVRNICGNTIPRSK